MWRKFKKKLHEKEKEVFKLMTSDLDAIEKSSLQCDDYKSKTEDLINTTNLIKFFEEVSKIEKLTEQSLSKIKTTYNSIPIFVPGEITQSNVGVLRTDDKLIDIQLSVIKEFQTELLLHISLCPCPDSSLWISNSFSEALQRVKPQNNTLQILSSYKVNVMDMALTPNNDLLLATTKSCLQQIKHSTGTIQDSIYNIDPFKIVSVHVSKDYKVMVGGTCIRQERYVVIVMNKEGKQLNVFEQDKQNLPLFRFPWRITSTTNATIYVADKHPNDDHGRLVILDPTGDIQYYTGHPVVNKDKPFRPVGLTTTPKDHVIVTDVGTYTLHILNDLGQLMTYFNTRDVRIQRPDALGFTSSGQLYIGSTVEEDLEDNAKLYQVNISGCS